MSWATPMSWFAVMQGGVVDVANYVRDNFQILDLPHLQNPNHPHPPRLCNTAQLKQRYISTKLLVLNLITLWQPYNLSLSVRYRRRNKRFNASSLKVERFCSTNPRGNACYEGKYNQLNPIYSWDFWATIKGTVSRLCARASVICFFFKRQ